MRVLSGMRPTGKLHIGHLFGALSSWVELQEKGHECFYFVADWHALTTHYNDTKEIVNNSIELVKSYLAVGIDPNKSTIFIQSEIKEHAELTLLFSMFVSVSRLERVPTYKEIKQQLSDKDLSNAGFLIYPVLQAADILIYRATGVPVGEDQVYHIELTREIARRFNYLYKEVFPEPEPILSKVPKLLGTDGRKMSKSYGNTIPLVADEETLKKMVMPMITDPARQRRTDPGNPEKCPVWDYHKAFGISDKDAEWVKDGCTNAKIGCVDCKKLLLKNMKERLEPIWERYNSLTDDYVKDVIVEGNKKARQVARETIEMVRDAMQLDYNFLRK
ncbi:tryptophanyl-tRNA synthetase [Thermosipho africanus H17ap60334]|jgi:tryptophanyl-tRNA synthetase|uniref:Tryptophan--tRNA ligase n=1 Tax=Thermosipho africanus (strain TCF52B) TaxID=484019 RepID=B7IG13_THEAB|nr:MULTISPECIES: tryptophan--tRNA ligase [Thermosipho]HCF37883.1 tryptophan--tRNA ligase [Thermosipho africanus]ACJ75027.1 tryptophanyl-tRNA synthetase [Thermosipho africanus TCF52B]EKF50243.1 tryptophanyl-tRNA synthetase [Thermosipho africanus H17ap60334]MBZ4649476.1 trpS [Thermosipho sp. (in: thermotogales)]MDK2838841.1 tryptophanyl-tRNA synthetase [Thermosipho sp. (in: thermotogales)]